MERHLPQALPKNVLQTLPCSLPTSRLHESVDVEGIAKHFVQSLACLSSDILSAQPIWRDLFALRGTLRTSYSTHAILRGWSTICRSRQARSGRGFRPNKNTSWLHVGFKFRVAAAPAAECHGFLALVLEEDDQWRICTIRTIFELLVGCADVDTLPEVDDQDRDFANRTTHVDEHNITNSAHKPTSIRNGTCHTSQSTYYDAIVAGAGQAGLSTAGRLQTLGVNYLVLESHSKAGENCAVRYESAKLHTPRDYNQLPFGRIFPSSYPEYLGKHDILRGYKDFIHKYVTRAGREEMITCRHLVVAVGSGGQIPIMPIFPNREDFQGEVLHSVDYSSAEAWAGKRAIVVGTANTAHDVSSDMVDAGLKLITMVQRSRTYVIPAEYFKVISDRTYNGTVRIDDADREQYSQPPAISRLLGIMSLHAMASKEPERFDALEKVGFRVERYGDISYQIIEKMGGHYIDVGCSEKISKGLIKIKPDALIPPDVIVFCTGFRGNMRTNVVELFGRDIAAQVDDFWTLDSEGELKGAFKPTSHPRLWYIWGTIGYCRYFSRHVALQIKADLIGTPLPIYNSQRRTGEHC
ncbi:flavin-containing monooxygenase [Talaromyces proteolyticus]|uniref:Flavin-containing monooxygenase n=1 Tax=Talaromyces proteolyticus TaxID=1131652 RepID=A0AAD4PWF7_9EURO|nr:flavin-containing monooxygenase [Talaromyces proteolyticus]KAH8691479.1 flavin-containing monooxygenase [Talaromyces proteolyticus]